MNAAVTTNRPPPPPTKMLLKEAVRKHLAELVHWASEYQYGVSPHWGNPCYRVFCWPDHVIAYGDMPVNLSRPFSPQVSAKLAKRFRRYSKAKLYNIILLEMYKVLGYSIKIDDELWDQYMISKNTPALLQWPEPREKKTTQRRKITGNLLREVNLVIPPEPSQFEEIPFASS